MPFSALATLGGAISVKRLFTEMMLFYAIGMTNSFTLDSKNRPNSIHIHRKDRSNLTHPPLLELIKLDADGTNNFSSQIKNDSYDPNRFTLTLDLEGAYVTDMGQYELRIYDEDKSILHPTLPMYLYVKARPGVSFIGENSHGYYHEGENIGLECNVKSYPIDEVILEIAFLNCTEEEECPEPIITTDPQFFDNSVMISGKEEQSGANNDSLNLELLPGVRSSIIYFMHYILYMLY